MTLNIKGMCPLCSKETLCGVDQEIYLRKTFEEWEKALSIRFPSAIWETYNEKLDTPIRLHKCSNCSFSQFLPIVEGNEYFYDAISKTEDSYYVLEKWEFKRAIKTIKKIRARTVLDIGCGSGGFLTMLNRACSKIDTIGFDFNPAAMQWARSKGHKIIDNLSIDAASNNRYDVVCLFQIIEHVADPFALLKQAKDLTNPNGILIVACPDAGGPIRYFKNALTDTPPHHVSRWYDRTMLTFATTHKLRLLDLAKEPLPSYLWDFYLPVMLENCFLPKSMAKFLNSKGFTKKFISLLRSMDVKHLWPLPGHTLYTAFRV